MSDFERLLKNVLRWFGWKGQQNGMNSPEAMAKILRKLEMTRDKEIPCDEVLAVLDQFAEIELRGEQAERIMPLVKHHMEMCPDCREEYEALMRILHAEAN